MNKGLRRNRTVALRCCPREVLATPLLSLLLMLAMCVDLDMPLVALLLADDVPCTKGCLCSVGLCGPGALLCWHGRLVVTSVRRPGMCAMLEQHNTAARSARTLLDMRAVRRLVLVSRGTEGTDRSKARFVSVHDLLTQQKAS